MIKTASIHRLTQACQGLPKQLRFAPLGLLIGAFIAPLGHGHGYVQQPQARQQFCVEDGGYWWPDDGSNMPNSACRAAFLASGTVPFTQHHEFSANVANYTNIEAVKAVVTDGKLCSAGDPAKQGMNLPHPDWQKTQVVTNAQGELDFIFFASTPHNPSFWEFYLSKPGFDPATQVLNWHNLDLIDSAANVTTEMVNGQRVYRIPVQLPANRQGDAILYTRWQRDDAAGEGFYNCSDITFGAVSEPQWFDKGYFLPQGTEAATGDKVWFRVFDGNGQELVFEISTITNSNQSTSSWAQELVDKLAINHSQKVQVGVKNSQGEINYKAADLRANQVWLPDNQHSFALDVKKAQTNQPPTLSLASSINAQANQSVNITLLADDPEGDALTYQWQVPAELTASGTNSATLVVNTGNPSATRQHAISVQVSDGVNSASAHTTLTVNVDSQNCQNTDPNTSNFPAWQVGTNYTQGQKVSHQQLVWQAKWWNNSEPRFNNDAWQLVSNIAQQWQAGKSYNSGDKVDHQQRQWQAKWWTQAEPGSDGSWADIGAATCP
ncbi:lytic polysaccharide monooxygenase [Simiduia curdlanivorans]|uniref:Lytic polysaccharide monooxygenase n=1 Tax=Simiduia curdlanivorans TaxID=1492769 RepID=A0ABV8V8U3_9GAMM|nr:lytic polysaccharide monooxygenase [Simiduia curdlanivorans]MDN3639333.1 lytic polysaccharide monooxygenase [Simiduia curdlanivorans]